jgi:hypothetical protein
MIRSLSVLASLLGASVFAPARAEVDECTNITSLPAVITTQGVYCLKQNLETTINSGAAITINANNVTIDCNDWKIGGLQAGVSTLATGITATDRLNITVRHCGVRGFRTGISLEGATTAGHLIEDNRVDLSTAVGIVSAGEGNVVRRNRVVDTGGRPGFPLTIAIIVNGSGALVAENIVNGVSVVGDEGNGSIRAIDVYGAGHEFRQNLISGLSAVGTGTARGFYGSGFGSYRDNTVIGPGTGPALDGAVSSSMCSGNRITGFTSSIINCADAGGNLSN